MSEFILDLTDFRSAAGKSQQIDAYLSETLDLVKNGELTFISAVRGNFADSFSRFASSFAQNSLGNMSDVASQLSEYYAEAQEDATELLSQRNEVLQVVGCGNTNGYVITHIDGYLVNNKCSNADEALATLSEQTKAVMTSSDWSGLKNSSLYDTDVSSYKTSIHGYLTNLRADIDDERETVADLSSKYTLFKQDVEDFEDYYSSCFNPEIFDEVEQANLYGNGLITGTAAFSDFKFAKKVGTWGGDLLSAYLDLLESIENGTITHLGAASGASSGSLIGKIGSKAIDNISALRLFSIDGAYVVLQGCESYFTTDGDAEDKWTAVAATVLWEGSKVVVKKAASAAGSTVGASVGATIGAAIGSVVAPGVGTAIGTAVGSAVGSFVGSVVADFTVDVTYEVFEDLGAKESLNKATDLMADTAEKVADCAAEVFTNISEAILETSPLPS